jgi:hypothetical protein
VRVTCNAERLNPDQHPDDGLCGRDGVYWEPREQLSWPDCKLYSEKVRG